MLNPSFYTEQRILPFYNPISQILFEEVSKNVKEIDEYLLQSEFEELLIKSLPVTDLVDFSSELIEKIRTVDLLDNPKGIELDLNFLRDAAKNFAGELALLLSEKFSPLENLNIEIEFALQKQIPAKITILQAELDTENTRVIEHFTISKIFWLFLGTILIWSLLVILLLFESKIFLIFYLGIYGIVLALSLFLTRTLSIAGLENVIISNSEFKNFSVLFLDTLREAFLQINFYALCILLISTILLLLSGYFHKFKHVT